MTDIDTIVMDLTIAAFIYMFIVNNPREWRFPVAAAQSWVLPAIPYTSQLADRGDFAPATHPSGSAHRP